MAKKVPVKKVAKKVAKPKVVAPQGPTLESLASKVDKLEAYLKAQVDVKNLGGDVFANYPEL